ncbi:alpha/beta hydrolase-fold protein [Oceanirhabdus seepicola]|uniref:Esterase family protein n=1 Tax=Oceanirhabdus seepicola TaxID=2828781 RepID=A0A9J6P4T6_9CLOT|nr:alpha/beta hydrolase-fold protein [Oceanirhabdus seepicola]MCM1991150.1 esterase family protein [Oceanirhabdus seepicola]
MGNKYEVKSKIIENLKSQINQGNLKELEKFWDKVENEGAPLIEEISENSSEMLVTFLYKENKETKNVVVLGSIPGYRYKENTMEKILNTDLWYKSYVIRNDVKFKYNFSINDSLEEEDENRFNNTISDPLNPKKFIWVKDEDIEDDEESYDSVFEMPMVKEEKWVKERCNNKKGKMELVRFNSNTLGGSRRLWIYLPNGYEKETTSCNLVVLTDGFWYANLLSAQNVFDNLINDKKVEPFVVVMIDTSSDKRGDELSCSDKMSDFICCELMKWIRENYNVNEDAAKTTIGGLSLGGLMAAYIGLKNSGVFGNALCQSGSFWWKEEWLIKEYEKEEKCPVRFFLNVGLLEDRPYDDEPVMMDCINKMRDVLIDKGYEVDYQQFQSGHDFLFWGETLADGLISLIGK